MNITVKAGWHSKGDYAVIYHGDLELWLPIEAAEALAKELSGQIHPDQEQSN